MKTDEQWFEEDIELAEKSICDVLSRHKVKAFELKQDGHEITIRVSQDVTPELYNDLKNALPLIYALKVETIPEQLEFNFGGKDVKIKDPSAPVSDAVTHPAHYNKGRFEVIEIIEDQGLNFQLGNAVKYICRAGKKDPTKVIEDLKKAVWYLEREIENHVAKAEGREPVRPNDMNPRRKSNAKEHGLAGQWVEIEIINGRKENKALVFEPDNQIAVRANLDAGDRGLVFTRL